MANWIKWRRENNDKLTIRNEEDETLSHYSFDEGARLQKELDYSDAKLSWIAWQYNRWIANNKDIDKQMSFKEWIEKEEILINSISTDEIY